MTTATEKKCSRCRGVKPASEFPPNPRNADGLMARCAPCVDYYKTWRLDNLGGRARYFQGWQNANRDARNAYSRQWLKNNPELARAQNRRYRGRYPGKVLAGRRLRSAVYGGEIAKPDACTSCGAAGRIEGHHHDYTKPYDVTWVCPPCHRKLDAARRAQGV